MTKTSQNIGGDVFRPANTLPGKAGPKLPTSIQEDLKSFLAAFPLESEEWAGILNSLKTTFGTTRIKPEDLIATIRTYFGIQCPGKVMFILPINRDLDTDSVEPVSLQ